MKKRGLGKGLEALLKNDAIEDNQAALQTISIKTLTVNPHQPRKTFSVTALAELADSIRQHGIIQPLVVRQLDNDRYELIAGERRFRAAKEVGLEELPVVIHNVSDEDSATFALIENIQREDLNVIEKAQGIKRLSEEFAFTHEQCAKLLGQSRSTITNLLRLLDLDEVVQEAVMVGKIDMGHARALLAVDGALQHSLLQQISVHGLTVRETEALINQHKEPKLPTRKSKKSTEIKQLEEKLTENVGARTTIQTDKRGQQRVTFVFKTNDDFHKWLNQMDLQS